MIWKRRKWIQVQNNVIKLHVYTYTFEYLKFYMLNIQRCKYIILKS